MAVRPIIEGSFVALTTCVVLLAEVGALSRAAKTAVEAEAKDSMMSIAKAVAATVDVREHESFVRAEQYTSKAFMAAEARLKAIRESDPRIVFVYTVRAKESRYHFVLDPIVPPRNGHEVDNSVMLMEPYTEDIPLALRQSAQQRVATVTDAPYTDKWGRFMSAYAPLIHPDTGKSVGVLAVDIEADKWEEKLAPMHAEARNAGQLAVVLSLIAGFIVFAIRSAGDAIEANRKKLEDAV